NVPPLQCHPLAGSLFCYALMIEDNYGFVNRENDACVIYFFTVYFSSEEEEILMKFGEVVKITREHYGWTAKSLAKMSGVPYETVYRLEKGMHDAPRLPIAS